jgi:hypothetical protein
MNSGHSTRYTVCIFLLGLACLALPIHAECPGECKSHQKISDTEGNFVGVLGTEDGFGSRVEWLGDLGAGAPTPNALAVSAPLDDDGCPGDCGAVWILFLNPDGSVNNHQKISNTQGNFPGSLAFFDLFGMGLAWLGDLGAGAPTPRALAVGAFGDGSPVIEHRGAVWILFLNSDGTVNAAQKISNGSGGLPPGTLDPVDDFGVAAVSLGDIDGDGVGDLAVGAFGDDDGGIPEAERGAVYVLFLDTDGTVKSYEKISSTEGGFSGPLDDGDWFGCALGVLGDLDSDGVGELVVGAYGDDDGGAPPDANRGAVWILSLDVDTTGPDPAVTVKWHQKISDTEGEFEGFMDDRDAFGSSLVALTDADRDGTGDLAVGAFLDGDGGAERGAMWVLFLHVDTTGSDPEVTVDWHQKISDTEGNFIGPLDDGDNFGWSATSIGDLDSDGIEDLAVGARYDDDGGFNRGAVWILFLNDTLTLELDGDLLEWGPPGGAVSYDIIRGDLGSLQSSGGDFSQATDECLENDHPDTSLTYLPSPSYPDGYWFLVRRVYSMLERGTYDTCGPSQVDARDDEIAASGVACP